MLPSLFLIPDTRTVSPVVNDESGTDCIFVTAVDEEVVTVSFVPSDSVTTSVPPSTLLTVPAAKPKLPPRGRGRCLPPAWPDRRPPCRRCGPRQRAAPHRSHHHDVVALLDVADGPGRCFRHGGGGRGDDLDGGAGRSRDGEGGAVGGAQRADGAEPTEPAARHGACAQAAGSHWSLGGGRLRVVGDSPDRQESPRRR